VSRGPRSCSLKCTRWGQLGTQNQNSSCLGSISVGTQEKKTELCGWELVDEAEGRIEEPRGQGLTMHEGGYDLVHQGEYGAQEA
jgi:hypothetical protein